MLKEFLLPVLIGLT